MRSFEYRSEARNDVIQKNQYRTQSDKRQQARINHRRNDVTAQIVSSALKLGQSLKNGREASARLAGPNHVHVQIRKVVRLRREAIRKRLAALEHTQNF